MHFGPLYFIHYGDLYSAPSRLLLRSAPDPCTTKKKSFETRVECVRKNLIFLTSTCGVFRTSVFRASIILLGTRSLLGHSAAHYVTSDALYPECSGHRSP